MYEVSAPPYPKALILARTQRSLALQWLQDSSGIQNKNELVYSGSCGFAVVEVGDADFCARAAMIRVNNTNNNLARLLATRDLSAVAIFIIPHV